MALVYTMVKRWLLYVQDWHASLELSAEQLRGGSLVRLNGAATEYMRRCTRSMMLAYAEFLHAFWRGGKVSSELLLDDSSILVFSIPLHNAPSQSPQSIGCDQGRSNLSSCVSFLL